MELRVPAHAVGSNALLEIGTCPRHNRPGVRTKKLTFYTKPPLWAYLLIVVGVLVAVIVILVLRKQVTGNAYECDECLRAQRRFRALVISAWVLDIGLLLAASADSSGVAVLLWLVVTVAALVYSFTGATHRIRGFLTTDQVWVDLKNADAGFAAAVQQRMAQAQAPS
jgi:hypothetical protein